MVTPLKRGNDAVPCRAVRFAFVIACAARVNDNFFAAAAKEHKVARVVCEIFPRRVKREAEGVGQGLDMTVGPTSLISQVKACHIDRAFLDREILVFDDVVGRKVNALAQPRAFGAGAVGIIKTEHAGGQFAQADLTLHTGQLLRKDLL